MDQSSDVELELYKWFPLTTWKIPATILIIYTWFVLKAGPHFMKNRKPYELKKTIMMYNLSQILFNSFGMIAGIIILREHDLRCQPTDFSNNPTALLTQKMCWAMYCTKFIDLLDTVFFILRKKTNQVTFLHVFHHILTPIYTAVIILNQPGGHGVVIGWLNSTVHVIMYSYYFIAGLGPEYQKYLWWKQYLTQIQIIQFALIFVHNGQLYFRDCDYPRWLVNLHVSISSLFLYLFSNFYYKTYNKMSKITSKVQKK